MEILRISKEEDFLKLKDQWNFLLLDSGLDNIFLTWEWMYNWWKVFKGKRDELFILVGRKDFTILGIAPFYINTGFYRKIRFLGSGIASSVHLSFIVRKDTKILFLTEVCEYLGKNSAVWDLVYLECVDSDNEITSFLKNYTRSKKWRSRTLKEHICFYIPLFSPWEEFKLTMSRSYIKRLQYMKRKLSRQGYVEWKKIDCVNVEEALSNFEIVVSLHQKRWQNLKCKIGGIFSNELMLKFLRIITEEFCRKKWLSINFLLLDGKAIATCCDFKFRKKIFGYIMGFDPMYKSCSPSSVCLWESLQFYINNGYQELDFARGGVDYKQKWTDKFRSEQDVLIIKRGLKGVLFLLDRLSFEFTKNFLKKVCPSKAFAYLRAKVFNRSR